MREKIRNPGNRVVVKLSRVSQAFLDDYGVLAHSSSLVSLSCLEPSDGFVPVRQIETEQRVKQQEHLFVEASFMHPAAIHARAAAY